MSAKSKIIIPACAFILMISGSIYTQDIPLKDTVIINSIKIKTGTGESTAENFSFKEASDWAENAHIVLARDAPPLIDNKGFFITQFQTVIPVSGYKPELIYRIYFDFFKYSGGETPFNSTLKIFIRDIRGNKRHVGTADVRNMSGRNFFEVQVPFDLSYPGKFDIILSEYAERTGNWGIWDIIVTSKKIDELGVITIDSAEKISEIEPKIFK